MLYNERTQSTRAVQTSARQKLVQHYAEDTSRPFLMKRSIVDRPSSKERVGELNVSRTEARRLTEEHPRRGTRQDQGRAENEKPLDSTRVERDIRRTGGQNQKRGPPLVFNQYILARRIVSLSHSPL